MMNEARLDVGFQAFTNASTTYLYALEYARQRVQGKDLSGGRDSRPVPIINHPDVRRMLMWMKSHVDGMRSLIYYTVHCFDKAACALTDMEKEQYHDLVELFTPIIKAYCSERSFDVCVQALQVYGGYGYIKDYPIEQRLRDTKNTSIFEGTNGIQAMDLLGRKLGMKNGAVFETFIENVNKTIALAKKTDGLDQLADGLDHTVKSLEQTILKLTGKSVSSEIKTAFAFAHPLLEVTGDVIMAWMLLWRAAVSVSKMKKKIKDREKYFYEGQVRTAEYFIHSILPGTLGKMKSIDNCNNAIIKIDGFVKSPTSALCYISQSFNVL